MIRLMVQHHRKIEFALFTLATLPSDVARQQLAVRGVVKPKRQQAFGIIAQTLMKRRLFSQGGMQGLRGLVQFQ